MRLLAIAAALMAMAFTVPPQQTRPVPLDADGTEPVFLLNSHSHSWVLSPARPTFPYDAGPGPVFQGMSGAATATPFGCGIADMRSSYFAGERGRLACVSRGPDGRVGLTRLSDSAAYSRVYDAAPADGGFVVVAHLYRRPIVRITTLSAEGVALRSVDLTYPPERSPDQIVILPSGRLVVLGNTGQTCEWTVIERSGATFRPISATPADHRFQCQTHARGTGVIRDQRLGVAWLRQYTPDRNALYRIDDNTDQGRGPATLVLRDIAAVLPMEAGSEPQMIAVLDGALYFEAPSVAGPVIGRYELATGKLSRTDLRVPSRRWQDADRVHGLMLGGSAGDQMQVAVLTPAATTEVRPVNRD